jgi:DNA-binding beta-propeller fold protein YncE
MFSHGHRMKFLRFSRLYCLRASAAWTLTLAGIPLEGDCQGNGRTTSGYVDAPRSEAPGTLLSHPIHNGSEAMGRTVTLNYLNGWLVVGQEGVGSRTGSDLEMRVFDVADPRNPVRLRPSDFGHSYPPNPSRPGGGTGDSWMNTSGETDSGFASHGTAKYGSYILPDVMRAQTFGGVVERGVWYIPNGVPNRSNFPIGNHGSRSSLTGPWFATYSSGYTPAAGAFEVGRFSLSNGTTGTAQFTRHALFNHAAAFGMGGWAPMFFGDLLIYAREVNDVDHFAGFSARDGVVVYRIPYGRLDDPDPARRTLDPQLLGSLEGGFSGYWPVLFSDGTGLYVIGADSNVLMGVDVSRAADPAGDGSVRLAANLVVPGFSNSLYPTFQDHVGFIHNRKIDMTRFLAGDPDPMLLTLNEATPPVPAGAAAAPSGVDTSQMSLVMGNLWVTGGYPHNFGSSNYRAQGMAIWVHQQAPDTVRPRVAFHIPQANRTNYPRHAPLSFILHEHSRGGGPINGVDFMVRPVQEGGVLGGTVAGFLIHDFSGVLTFTPDAPLQGGTTYQVDFLSDPVAGAGFRDVAGNWVEPYSFRFSTGSALNSNPLPVLALPVASKHTLAPGETVTVSASATGAGPLEYRFHFGESWSAWGTTANATHTFSEIGRPRVLVQVRDANGGIATETLTLLVVQAPQGPAPTSSGPIALGVDGEGQQVVWAVNPDADTVAVVNAATRVKQAEYPTGKNPRTVARDASGRYWVACHGSDDIWVLNGTGTLHHRIVLRYGSAPYGVAASPDGSSVYATLYGSGRVAKFSTANPAAAPVERETFPTPRALAVSGDGSRVFVTRFISAERHGEVGEFRGADLVSVRVFRILESIVPDSGDRAAGVPNYLAGIAISPDGKRAAVVSKQDNTRRGVAFGVGDLTHETTVRAVVSFLDLETSNAEIRNMRRDFDNSESPSAVAWSPAGDRLFVSLQGNNRVVGLDFFQILPLPDATPNTNVTRVTSAVVGISLETGLAPQGVVVDPASKRIFTHDFMGRCVSVYDAQEYLDRNRLVFALVARTGTVAQEALPANVLLGKQIFYNAADPRMGADSYISCASCHVDGGDDGRTWDFTGRGEGFRRTTDLRGRSGTGHGNLHWSGNFDEVQDFEHVIRGAFGGQGFLPLTPEQFAQLHPSPASGKTGLNVELDALAAYVESLGPGTIPRSPFRTASGAWTAAAATGRMRFEAQGCAACHAGDRLTSSVVVPIGQSVLRSGTLLAPVSGSRLGAVLGGIDTPSLHGLHASRVFLHHGLASGLEEVFSRAGGRFLNAADGVLLTTVTPSAVRAGSDMPQHGGGADWQSVGGHVLGAIGGRLVSIQPETGATEAPGVRFLGVDGGAGGMARIGIRYVRDFSNGTAVCRVNGTAQNFTLLQQEGRTWGTTSGWNWMFMDVALQPGPTNTVEILRAGSEGFMLNGLWVMNTDDRLAAEFHGRVQAMPTQEREELLAYLRQMDGRDASGVPFQWQPQRAERAPGVIQAPTAAVLAQGGAARFRVVVSGAGPFSFQWMKDGIALVGATQQELAVSNANLADAGNYTVRISNADGTVVSEGGTLVVNPALQVGTASLPQGRVQRFYQVPLLATGGVGIHAWSVVSGVLPPGMDLLPDGTLRGTPAAPAREELRIRVSDSSGASERVLLLEVAPRGGFSTDPDLLLHYTFDEGTGSRVWDVARAGNNHSASVPGAFWSGSGKFGGSYGPGGQNQTVQGFFPANQGDLNFDPRTDSFTVTTWVRSNTSTLWRAVFSKEAPNTFAQYRLWTAGSSTVLQFHTAGASQNGSLPPGADLRGDQWHLLAYVNGRVGNEMRTRLYRNGELLAERAPGASAPVSELMRVGDISQGGNAWGGWLDDFRVYRRALSPTELQTLFTEVLPAGFFEWMAARQPAIPEDRRAEMDDPDGDGLTNLMEYALGGEPGDSENAPHPQMAWSGDQWVLRYRRGRGDVVYEVQTSATMEPGSWTPAGVLQDVSTAVGGMAEARMTPQPGEGRRFLRLRVWSPE